MGDNEGNKNNKEEDVVLVVRKPCFDLPTGCPSCLPAYLYLKFSRIPFTLNIDRAYPDSETIPLVEYGEYVAFNCEKGGVIESLKEDDIVDLDKNLPHHSFSERLAMRAMICSWLADATTYELWVGSDVMKAYEIYFSDLPWILGKALHWKQTYIVKQHLRINNSNAEDSQAEIHRRAALAYEALSEKLGGNNFFYEDRPTSLDALFLGHSLFVLHVLSDSSPLRCQLTKYDNLVRYTENRKTELFNGGSSHIFGSPGPSTPSTSRRPTAAPRASTTPKRKEEKGRSDEEKTFRRRGKYFLIAQLVSVVIFLSLMGSHEADIEVEDDEGFSYEN